MYFTNTQKERLVRACERERALMQTQEIERKLIKILFSVVFLLLHRRHVDRMGLLERD